MQMNPYLLFTGECEEAFKFYEKLLGGKIQMMMTHEGTPAESGVPAEWRKKTLHARMTTPGGVLMGSDAPPSRQSKPQGFSVSISVDNPTEAERIYNGLAEGALAVTMPIQETFWARRFGMLTDRFGIPWMVNCEKQ
ncbi:MAG: VOC family protein [Acidobacteria bacterium]|nr:MAG: VOC family protein [Acidobacteriota bacterium]